MNSCLRQPGIFSCAVDSFLELSFAIFKDSLRDSQCNDFFDMVLQACQQLEMQSVQTDLMNVRKPVWAHLRQHCNSFAACSDDAVFSDIFTLNTVGAMTDELKSLFLVQQSNQTVCSSFNNPIVSITNVFVFYITSLSLDETQFESDICRANYYQIAIPFSAMFVGVWRHTIAATFYYTSYVFICRIIFKLC